MKKLDEKLKLEELKPKKLKWKNKKLCQITEINILSWSPKISETRTEK